MRIIFFLFLTSITIYSYSQNAQNIGNKTIFNSIKEIEISGKIKNYIPSNENQFITFRTYQVTGKIKDTSVFINSHGIFDARLFQPFKGDIALLYQDEYLTLYAEPNEKINLGIDISKLKSEQNPVKSITLTGKSAVLTKTIIDFQANLRKQKFKNEPDWKDKIQPDKQFANARISRMKEELFFLNEYTRYHKILDKTFEAWATNDLIYKAGFDIAFFAFAGKLNTSLTDKEFIEFFSDIPIVNNTALNNSNYYNFLKTLTTDFMIIININPMYADEKKQSGYNPVPVYLKKLDDYSTGITKQLMYYNIYLLNSPKSRDYFLDRFNANISDTYLKKLLFAAKQNSGKIFEPYDIVKKLQEYKTNDSIKARLINLFNTEKGKYIFADFWGDWCMPCMHEMPFYPTLIEQFKNSPITFVFFAVETAEEKATAIKNKYGINARFITLNDNEAKIMNNVLQFTSYPSHFVLRPDGFVVDNSIAGIVSGNELDKNTIDRIRKYLFIEK